ncbi:cytochrome P450 9e2-like [Belonocnema kinseyi]|uniref:cytochrome P450 9e2-like n=1 Tax=Belonocnema kinseyi TaxID=2817044 RepID=UPI00143D6147|nr:cytochrome P450 9e2-like [Belonocnema kinseyi]
MDLLTIILTVLASGLAYYFCKKKNIFDRLDIPYDPPKPIFGSMFPCVLKNMNIFQLAQKLYNDHSEAKYFGMYEFGTPLIVIRDPEIIKSITIKNVDLFLDHQGFTNEEIDPLFGKFLFSLKGNNWREMRNILSPLFTSSKMKTMFNMIVESTVNFTDALLEKSKKKNDIINLKDVFTRLSADTMASCAFGIKIDSMNDPENIFYVVGRKASDFEGILSLKFLLIRNLKFISRLFGVTIFSDSVNRFFSDVTCLNIRARKEKGIIRQDFLQMMIEAKDKNNRQMSDEEITAGAFGFLFAGLDTVSTALCFIIHEIAANQDFQKRLQKDIDLVLENCNGEPSYNEINEMPYLEAVIKEGLRLYPPGGFVDRVCTGKFELPPVSPGKNPVCIEPGMPIWIPIFALHRDPNYYKNPEEFDPERFLGDNKINMNSGTFLPFGMGPRICIGYRFAILEIKVMLFNLLTRCNFKPCSKTRIPLKVKKDSLILLPEGGFWLKVEARK